MAAYLFIIINGHQYLQEHVNKLDLKDASIVYDKHGKEAAKFYMLENRESVKLEEVPELVRQAFIATEDKRFETHDGIDYIGVARALVKDIIARKAVEGASTITQQLARNLFLSNEKTFFRKATEMSIATALENKFTKDQILEMYLNRIYFGKGAYGIKAASKTYFGKENLADLELHEIAILAGIPKAPGYYNPIDHPDRAKNRRDTVLMLMEQQQIITYEEKVEAQAQEVEARSYQSGMKYPSFMDLVLQEAQEVTGLSEDQLYTNGYRIYTTLDPAAQDALEEAFNQPELFPEDGPEQKVQSSMVILDHKSGGIAALIGGRDYARKGWNRAVVKRQPGSVFKPIASFAPALETGEWHPYSMLSNQKQSFNGYSPQNLSGKYSDRISMIEALRNSINIPTVWLLHEIGVKKGLDFAERLGIEMSTEDRNLAIALGGLTHGTSPLEMARAYGAFAAGGKLSTPHLITSITSKDGKVLYRFEPDKHMQQVMSEKTAWYMTLMLKDVVEQGTGKRAAIPHHEVAGKTGTTESGIKGVNKNRDIWFVGYTPNYTAAVWMGFDRTDEEHVLSDYGGTAASLFAKVMAKALANKEPSSFQKPEGVPHLTRSVDSVRELTASFHPVNRWIEVSWLPLDGEKEYRLYRKSSAETDYIQINASSNVSVIDFAIEPGLTYSYYVVVYDPKLDVESEPSAIVEAAVPVEDENAVDLEEESGEADPIDPLPIEPEDLLEPVDPVNPDDPFDPLDPHPGVTDDHEVEGKEKLEVGESDESVE